MDKWLRIWPKGEKNYYMIYKSSQSEGTGRSLTAAVYWLGMGGI